MAAIEAAAAATIARIRFGIKEKEKHAGRLLTERCQPERRGAHHWGE